MNLRETIENFVYEKDDKVVLCQYCEGKGSQTKREYSKLFHAIMEIVIIGGALVGLVAITLVVGWVVL